MRAVDHEAFAEPSRLASLPDPAPARDGAVVRVEATDGPTGTDRRSITGAIVVRLF